ncbi:MAG: 1,4-alpha-glucan branching protein GlgB [Rhodanobacteraceae bacterium]|nr:1,4-alpha-glucan branching protein GlgB [Rhodanobacteraceae bacterium]
MLDQDQRQALLEARHGDPFAVLGLHADGRGQLWLRALLPGASRVEVQLVPSGQMLAVLNAGEDGWFEGRIPRRRKRFEYRLAVHWQDDSSGVYADAYAFGALISDAELRALRSGEHPRPYQVLGAHSFEVSGVDGVRFALWAPNARRVSVVGSFNGWDGRRHPMRLRHEGGIWEIFIPHVAAGDLYKYEIVGADGQLLPLKADPYAFAAQLRPDNASRISGLPARKALPPERAEANQRLAPISIYEVHAPSWRHGTGEFPCWDELAATLPAYAAELGFTHIELLPVSEYPFDGSWGYQPLGLYAPSSRFGDPDGLVRFVAACHARGVGVLLDWVPAHFPADAHGLAQFDGTALYEYADPREGFHRDWNTLIYNFGRTEVASFLTGSALYWLESFAVDGLRVDAVASMLYRDYSRQAGEWIPNQHGGRENLEAIALLRNLHVQLGTECPGSITLAEESTAFPQVTAPTYAGGLGFHFKWNMGWMNDTLRYIAEDPVHRRWHHDKLSFGLVYAFSENFVLPISHDEVVHGKGSMLAKMPGDDWQRFANLRAYYGFMWGHPGKKLLFMGQEFAQPQEWNHEQALPWHLLNEPRHAQVQRLIGDLNRLYRAQSALHRLDCETAGFQWLIADDSANSVYAWARLDGAGGAAIVVCNFTPVPRHDYRLPVPEGLHQWREVLNTDSSHYGGSDNGNAGQVLRAEAVASHGRSHSLSLCLPPLATLYLLPA